MSISDPPSAGPAGARLEKHVDSQVGEVHPEQAPAAADETLDETPQVEETDKSRYAVQGTGPSPPRILRSPGSLRKQTITLAASVDEQRIRHEVLAGRWNMVAGWTRLIVALAASLSTITVLSNDHVAAIVFSVTTAVISALNVAYSPADTAKAHRVAATRFGHSWNRLQDMSYVLAGGDNTIYITKTEYTSDGRPYDAGYYAAATQLTPAELSQLAESLANITAEIETVEESAPPINRLRNPRDSTVQDGVPQTFWGMRRYKRKLRYAAEARRCYEQANRERAAWFSSAQPPPPYTPSSGNGRD